MNTNSPKKSVVYDVIPKFKVFDTLGVVGKLKQDYWYTDDYNILGQGAADAIYTSHSNDIPIFRKDDIATILEQKQFNANSKFYLRCKLFVNNRVGWITLVQKNCFSDWESMLYPNRQAFIKETLESFIELL